MSYLDGVCLTSKCILALGTLLIWMIAAMMWSYRAAGNAGDVTLKSDDRASLRECRAWSIVAVIALILTALFPGSSKAWTEMTVYLAAVPWNTVLAWVTLSIAVGFLIFAIFYKAALKFRECRHTEIEIFRCHKDVAPKAAPGRTPIWTDRHGVLNFARCTKCNTVLDGSNVNQTIYGERD